MLAAEIGLRVAQLGAPIWHQADAQLGWRLRAHTQGFENGVFADINVAGQRDVDHRLDKPNGVYRIAVLGDEYSEALGLRLRHIWWWQLPRELERCGFQSAKHIEVLNFGVAGYGTAQEYVMLESAAMRYQPDLVLLQFANRDDVADNSPALAAEKDRPFFVLDALGVARIDDSFATSTSFEARSQFRYELLSELAERSRLVQLARRWSPMGTAHADASAGAALVAPRDAVWEEAWRTTEALIAKMNAYAARNGAKLVVVAVPDARQLREGLDYPERRLVAFGAKNGIELLTLTPAMRGAPEKLYSAAGLWSEAGHRTAAKLIAERLCTSP